MAASSVKPLTEEDYKLLVAYFKYTEGSLDKEKVAEELKINKSALSMRMVRLRQKITNNINTDQVSHAEDTTPSKSSNKRKVTNDNYDPESKPTGKTTKRSKLTMNSDNSKGENNEAGGGHESALKKENPDDTSE